MNWCKRTSVNLCAEGGRDLTEVGRDIEVNLSKRVEAASGLEQLPGNLCAVRFRRDVDLNLFKRVEVTGCGLGSLRVSKQVPLARTSMWT